MARGEKQDDNPRKRWRDQREMLINRIARNRRRLDPWLRREKITCFRIYDRDIPEIPLAVDWYEGRLHVADFRTDRGEGDGPDPWLLGITGQLAATLAVKPEDVFVKSHHRAEGGGQYPRRDRAGSCFTVREGGLAFLVNLSDFLDTGIFLDHRNTRQMVRDEARGRRCLNLFAYTGAFSVFAAAGGAAETTTVDLSNTYLEWAEANMRRNGFTGHRHRLVRDDVLSALEERRVQGTYDLVVLDPPTLSKSKAMKRPFDIQQDHVLLLNRILERVARGGVVYFSTNYQRFRLQRDAIACRSVDEITEKTVPRDFRNRKVHRCWRLEKG